MNVSRRNFLSASALAGSALWASGCCGLCCGKRTGKVALQLYSLKDYIRGIADRKTGKQIKPGVGIARALADIRAIGYEGVEFAGYYGFKPCEIRKMLDDNGLVACGTHVGNAEFAPDKIKATCEFNLGYGNTYICCPGGGNMPPKCNWSAGRDGKPFKGTPAIDDFVKKLCDYYNTAAETAKTYGCRIGLHNHTWEHAIKMTDGTSYWDYFFSHTSNLVCMEQDVGWSTCAGVDPVGEYAKYPHRSPTLHAKENGTGPDFHAILGRPAGGVKGVDWDRLFPATDADGVEWYVVECERHFDSLAAVRPSWEFLHAKGRC